VSTEIGLWVAKIVERDILTAGWESFMLWARGVGLRQDLSGKFRISSFAMANLF
jgi:hypothetical protein